MHLWVSALEGRAGGRGQIPRLPGGPAGPVCWCRCGTAGPRLGWPYPTQATPPFSDRGVQREARGTGATLPQPLLHCQRPSFFSVRKPWGQITEMICTGRFSHPEARSFRNQQISAGEGFPALWFARGRALNQVSTRRRLQTQSKQTRAKILPEPRATLSFPLVAASCGCCRKSP